MAFWTAPEFCMGELLIANISVGKPVSDSIKPCMASFRSTVTTRSKSSLLFSLRLQLDACLPPSRASPPTAASTAARGRTWTKTRCRLAWSGRTESEHCARDPSFTASEFVVFIRDVLLTASTVMYQHVFC